MGTTPPADRNFAELMSQVRAGSTDAIRELVETYTRHVMIAIRRHLNDKLRNQYDSIDFSQAVWGSFFRQSPDCYQFENPAQLIAYLISISKYKVVDECRKRLKTQRYDVSREQQVPDSGIQIDRRQGGPIPTPSAIATANERWEQLLENMSDDIARALRMRANGATYEEIALATGLNERSIRRVITKLRTQIKK